MARRRGAGEWSEGQVAELGLGRFGYHPRLHHRQCKVPQWCPQCSSGWRCSSYFESREHAEDCYWSVRDRLMADENLGNRPLGWWMFEADSVCQHSPRCPLPDSAAGRDAYLEKHDQLAAEELALFARARQPVDG